MTDYGYLQGALHGYRQAVEEFNHHMEEIMQANRVAGELFQKIFQPLTQEQARTLQSYTDLLVKPDLLGQIQNNADPIFFYRDWVSSNP